ncbi:hypothetical protein CO659_03985 [Rhizobium sp. S9]|uniref:hypothetical protein n=1 Tax=Rhizobium sp. S9 TaxID=2035454 RepID=UPI000BEA7193|nr:hypothetical protein [Rhizobium sp. S9]PDS99902.1 hypothetical protein CO659_03985 [Rhizobium sp. S9]
MLKTLLASEIGRGILANALTAAAGAAATVLVAERGDIAAPSHQEEHTGSFLERATLSIGWRATGRAAIAGLARIMVRLLKKHPLVAAELFLSGAGRAGEVGWQELAGQLKRRKARRKKVLRSVPLVPIHKDS